MAASDAYAPPSDVAVTVARASGTYPIRISAIVSRAALGAWNAPPLLPLIGGSGLLGAFSGLLAARLIGRPLDTAIRARAFRPYDQPIFARADRHIVGCEMLVRWVLPDGPVLPPSAFIPLAGAPGGSRR